MNHQQWLEWRRQGIGASDAPIIMKVSPWKTPLQLWEQKLYGGSEELENSSMSRGKELEEPARIEFEKLMNVVVFPQNLTHPEISWMRASLDGMDLDGKVMVEIKCPNRDDHNLAKQGKIPPKYYPQCQHQMAVAGLPGMYYYSFDGKNGVVVEVARDQSYIDDQMLPKEKEFWSMVIEEKPPEMEARDRVDMGDHEEWRELTEKWKETNKLYKSSEESLRSLKQRMVALSQHRSAVGNNTSMLKSMSKGTIDYPTALDEYIRSLREMYPDIDFPELLVEQYRKPPIVKYTVRVK